LPNLKDIRRRIASVRSTQKITRAMKMVAAARLRRAQGNIEQLRPYARRVLEVLSAIATRAEQDDHPLLARREPPQKVLLVVLTSDRGLCGGFNSNINRTAEREARARAAAGAAVVLDVIGRKGRDYLRRRPVKIRKELIGVFGEVSHERAGEIGRDVVREYTNEGLDACFLVYNEFKSVMTQRVVVEQLLPVQSVEGAPGQYASDFIYEPTKAALLDRLPAMYVELEVYRALLESIASELGARMTAMDNATKNADEMIGNLTLQANRARQAGITKELLEVVAGAESLRG
jgi:F-type H+-transporting ATPase subunit gamma